MGREVGKRGGADVDAPDEKWGEFGRCMASRGWEVTLKDQPAPAAGDTTYCFSAPPPPPNILA